MTSPSTGPDDRGSGGPPADLAARIVGAAVPTAGPAASSALSADELLLVQALGFDPLGIVVGAAVFHAGLVGPRVAGTELVPLSAALLAAREQATARMRAQAVQRGASGIVGAQVEIAAFERRHHLARVVAVGTAVTHVTGPDEGAPPGRPFVAGLGGQELAVLVDCGYEPVDLVMGVCVYHVARQRPGAWVRNLVRTGELATATAALYEAREVAVARLQAEAAAAGADGVVGVSIAQSSHAWGARAVELSCIGTAVRRRGGAPPVRPATVVSVRDRLHASDPAALSARVARRRRGADR